MYVCICNKVTDKEIHKAAGDGACSVDCLTRMLNVGGCCGKCKPYAHKVLTEAHNGLNSDVSNELQLQSA